MFQIAVTNWTNATLSFQNAKSHGGTSLAASPSSIGHGATMTVTVTIQPIGGGSGGFSLSGGNVAFAIGYGVAPNGQFALDVVSQTSGFVALVGQPEFKALPGSNVSTTLNLYQGVASGTQAPYGYVVPLAASPYTQTNNCADFANSLYGPNVRQFSLVSTKFEQPPTTEIWQPADFTGGQLTATGGVVDTLFKAMANNTGADGKILRFLANFLVPASLQGMNMWIPALRWGGMTGTSPSLPAYELRGYDLYRLSQGFQGPARWQESAPYLKIFLSLLVSGAHFVVISADADYDNQGVARSTYGSLLEAFVNSGLPQSQDPGNSHYTDVLLNVSGKYYLDIGGEWAPPGSGLMLALLFGSTVNKPYKLLTSGGYNTFLQLEGWQASVPYSKRHKTDYNAHEQSLWNFSTFGASPYSEKRGTTIFLAPPQWVPTVYSNTFMMPYVGAYPVTLVYGTPPVKVGPKPPRWFDSSVVSVQAGTPAAPAQYNVDHYT